MTFPVVAARTSTVDVGSDSAHPIGLGSPSAGDLLLVFFSANVSTGGVISIQEALSGPGWTVVATSSATSTRLAVFAKIATGGDSLTVITSATVQAASLAYRITGHGATVAAGSFASANSTNGDPPAVSISGAAQDVLFLAALASQLSVASAAPASYGTLTTASGSISQISVAERNLNGTTDDPGSFTNTSQNWTAVTVAIPELAITSNARASQAPAEVLSGIDARALLTQLSADVISAVDARMSVSQFCVEVISENVPDGLGAGPQMLLIAT